MKKRLLTYGMLAFLLIFILGYVFHPAMIASNYYRIWAGMDEPDVTALLGGPDPGPDWRHGIFPRSGWCEGWNRGGHTIVLTYDEKCKLVSKECIANPQHRSFLDEWFGVDRRIRE